VIQQDEKSRHKNKAIVLFVVYLISTHIGLTQPPPPLREAQIKLIDFLKKKDSLHKETNS
jgi:hypothetical protein